MYKQSKYFSGHNVKQIKKKTNKKSTNPDTKRKIQTSKCYPVAVFHASRATITRDIKRRSFTQRSKRHFSLFKRISDAGGYVNPFFMEFKNARSRYVAFRDRSPFRGAFNLFLASLRYTTLFIYFANRTTKRNKSIFRIYLPLFYISFRRYFFSIGIFIYSFLQKFNP